MPFLVDTHCHLNFKAFQSDYEKVIERAFEKDVRGIINVGAALSTSRRAVKLAKDYSYESVGGKLTAKKLKDGKLYASVGLHPIHVKQEDFDFAEFKKLAEQPETVAIGETGLDKYHNPQDLPLQKELFLKHIKLANQVGKPLIIHNRDAASEIYSILIGQSLLPGGVMHYFSEDWHYAESILDMGFYLSFTGFVTWVGRKSKTFEVVQKMPLERLMIETDAPYVVPEPYKSEGIKKNEPAFVVETAKAIAKIRGIRVSSVLAQTTRNAIQLFNLK